MTLGNYKIDTNTKLTKKTIDEVISNIDLNEEEQTYINAQYVYEVNIDDDENEIYIKRYSYKDYAKKYGEGTLLDLKERLE